MQRFRQSGSDELSNSSSADEEAEEEDIAISPLAMMDERSPEAWLGNFLAILGVAGSARYSTIKGSANDATLMSQLREIAQQSNSEQPLRLFDADYAAMLKKQDWSTWWRMEGELGRYSYAVLAMSLLGERSHGSDLAAMYSQSENSRIHKDAHYVLCHRLGKHWPGYQVTERDLGRLASGI